MVEPDKMGDTSMASTFSEIATPAVTKYMDMLNNEPPLASNFNVDGDRQAPINHGHNAAADARKNAYSRLKKSKSHVDIEHTFKHIFKKNEFKGRQREIMQAALAGMDILVVAPTGMGKSICFQVPAVAEEHGLTIVVTPLLALMENQVHQLEKLNIPCAMLTSRSDDYDKKRIEKDMLSGHPRIRLLYVTPERLAMGKFIKLLDRVYRQGELSRLVIDEAHCISEWGYNFRQEYQQLGNFRARFDRVPIMALTASATKNVQDDIITSLDMRLDRLYRVIHSFNRSNLFYEVRYMRESVTKKLDDIHSFITNLYRRKAQRNAKLKEDDEEARNVSGIIYCRAKKTCDLVADFLRKKGVNAAAFHRGLKDLDNDRTAAMWRDNEKLSKEGKRRVDCIVATVAFGMGIDAPGCRYVIHYDLPTSFEGYYQESGRAGRDGHASRCVVYYSRQDAELVRNLVAKAQGHIRKRPNLPAFMADSGTSSFESFVKMLENVKTCRHIGICQYFGERPKPEDLKSYCDHHCDVCKAPTQTAISKKVLDPPDVIATQKPALAHLAAEEWNDEESERLRRAAAVAGLPGFAKASDLPHLANVAPAANDVIMVDGNISLDVPDYCESDDEQDIIPDGNAPSPRSSPVDSGVSGELQDVPMLADPAPDLSQRVWKPRRMPTKHLSRIMEIESQGDGNAADIVPPSLGEELPTLRTSNGTFQSPEIRTRALRPLSPGKRSQNLAKIAPNIPIELDKSDDEVSTTDAQPLRPIKRPIADISSLFDDGMVPEPILPQPLQPPIAKDSFYPEPVHVSRGVSLKGNLPNTTSNRGFKVACEPGNARSEHIENIDIGRVEAVYATIKIRLTPDRWEKRIKGNNRDAAVRQLASGLSRVFLASSGKLSRSEEAEVIKRINLQYPFPSTRTMSLLMLFTALELECDAFFTTMSDKRYQEVLKQYSSIIAELRASCSWLGGFPTSDNQQRATIFSAMQRAAKHFKSHTTQQKFSQDEDGFD